VQKTTTEEKRRVPTCGTTSLYAPDALDSYVNKREEVPVIQTVNPPLKKGNGGLAAG
jgi:hypothetical protein